MVPDLGRILEFRLEPDGRRSMRIGCEAGSIPAPGKYVLADIPDDADALLAVPLFAQAAFPDGFLAAPVDGAGSPAWEIGAEVRLRGPLGRGFHLPPNPRNLALAALGDTAARLLPLIGQAGAAALFTDLPVPDLPTSVEFQPLAALADALGWADYLAVDVPLERVDGLAGILGRMDGRPLPPGQVLVQAPMPCGGLAECGVCALGVGRKAVLLCVDGPVRDLRRVLTN